MKYPGKILNEHPETDPQVAWFNEVLARQPVSPNPCVRAYGPGPENETCKHCWLFLRKEQYCKPYFKCFLRGDTNGPGTDHRANWPACKRFVNKPKP
jgi:hypothetical protein